MSSQPDHPGPLSPLGRFLRSRRHALARTDVDPRPSGPRHGLSREDVARLAGISTAYLARLEQGMSVQASANALNGLAHALRLDDADRELLFRFAGASSPSALPFRESCPEHVAPGTTHLLDAMADIPSLVLDCRDDVLAWNRLGHRLLAPELPYEAPSDLASRPNLAKMLFLDPRARDVYRNWGPEARCAVARLHELASARPDDPALMRLIGDLVVASDDFARLWSDSQEAVAVPDACRMHHPEAGELLLHAEVLTIGNGRHRLVAYCPEPGSSSAARLHELATQHIR